ncbi:MAG: SGNH/GDSL hydrolase family protein [Bacillota bacterium]|jgi:lysophospholipase L1-like esterase|nr:SGNH/GDSL hydrolase family protein [Bacillota bacterium]HHU42790.1 SGNH/GDSL hydrolase family protein [Clostridiales bacterium]
MKKLIVVLIVFVLLSIAIFSFAAVGYHQRPTTILFLGDSIAEGIAGMSPISERERYAYYAVVGTRNNYKFINQAVSGSRSRDLLKRIKREDTDVKISRTRIQQADIIHVSILGNDLLLNDLGEIIIKAAQEDFTIIDNIVANSSQIFAEIVWCLKALNPNATLFFQNVYNPIFEDSWLITQSARNQLDALGIEPSQYRELAGILLIKLNGIMSDYLKENPDAFYLMDAFSEFDRLYQEDPEWGRDLISVDCVHPSFAGHAVLADMTQAKLEEIGLAKPQKALKNYKEMKKEQLNRLYKDELDVNTASVLIDKAKSCPEVTKTYFQAIKGKLPSY